MYGLADDGSVDKGGVSQTMRGRQSTKDWLENVIPRLTDPEIVGVNVHPVLRKTEASQIDPGKALYVVDIPDSDRAPHQSVSDRLYYVGSARDRNSSASTDRGHPQSSETSERRDASRYRRL